MDQQKPPRRVIRWGELRDIEGRMTMAFQPEKGDIYLSSTGGGVIQSSSNYSSDCYITYTPFENPTRQEHVPFPSSNPHAVIMRKINGRLEVISTTTEIWRNAKPSQLGKDRAGYETQQSPAFFSV